MIVENYLTKNALEIIKGYSFDRPFSLFLKSVFKQNKNWGARDRRNIRTLCYAYLRLGKSLNNHPPIVKMYIGFFLTYNAIDAFSQRVLSNFNQLEIESINKSPSEKLILVQRLFPEFKLEDLISKELKLSSAVVPDDYLLQLLIQPLLWIRINQQYKKQVIEVLSRHSKDLYFSNASDLAVGMPSGVDLEKIPGLKSNMYEVQDLSSQLTGQFFNPIDDENWFDACAGSGGKSLMLLDKNPNVNLLVSDIRPQILTNLKTRLKAAGNKKFKVLQVDLTKLQNELPIASFDKIILDIPCSGSGTWARTPEQIFNFDANKLNEFTSLQASIISNIWMLLKKGGELFYITCSVMYEENEGIVDRFAKFPDAKVVQKRMLIGENNSSDMMFIASIIKQ